MIWMRKMPISLNCHCTVLCNCHFVHIVHLFIFPPPGVQSPSVFLFFLTPVFSLQGLTFSKTDHTSLFRSWFSTFSVFFKPFLILSSVLWRLAGVPHFPNFDLLTPRVAWGLSWCAPTPAAPTGARHCWPHLAGSADDLSDRFRQLSSGALWSAQSTLVHSFHSL